MDTFISRVYKKTIEVFNNKCDLSALGALFPHFVEAIRDTLNKPQYSKLLFDSVHVDGFLDSKIEKTCTLGTGTPKNWLRGDELQRLSRGPCTLDTQRDMV
jgi:hypothetical protein